MDNFTISTYTVEVQIKHTWFSYETHTIEVDTMFDIDAIKLATEKAKDNISKTPEIDWRESEVVSEKILNTIHEES